DRYKIDTQKKNEENGKKQQQQQQAPVVVVSSKENEIPKPQFKESKNVVVLYDCLKENKDLTEDEKECLMQYEEYRVKLALKFAETEKPTTTLIQMMVWHCQAKVPPQPVGNRLTE